MSINIEKHLQELQSAINNIGGEFDEFLIEPPAIRDELYHIESLLPRALPRDLKEFVLTTSRKINFDWFLPDEFKLPQEFSEIFSGGLDFELSSLPEHEKGRADWQRECFPDKDDEYDAVWHNKLAFHHVANGDYLAFDELDRIIYLSHDDGEGHGVVMANSFTDLIDNWLPLGCPGPEDWQWLPFLQSKGIGIKYDSDVARKWLTTIGV